MKTIIKRSMAEERYSGDKIVKAMEKAFISVGVEHDADLIADLLRLALRKSRTQLSV